MIGPLSEEHRPEVNRIVAEEWAGPMIVSGGVAHDAKGAEGLICVENGELTGFALYELGADQCEVLVLQSLREDRGVGTALLKAVLAQAKRQSCAQAWLVTTNDNTRAIRFYQKFGFTLTAVRWDAMTRTRQLKPGVPLLGIDGIPLRHEPEFRIAL